MESRKIIIYAIFAVVVIYGFYFHFLSGQVVVEPSTKPLVQTASPVTATLGTIPNPDISNVYPENTVKTNNAKISKWGKDPFRNSRKQANVKTSALSSGESSDDTPYLSAISYSSGTTMAIIDQNIMQVGDKIGAWRLVEIARDAALISGPRGRVWIKLGGS